MELVSASKRELAQLVSQDGRYIYFDSFGRETAFFRVLINDHKLEHLVSLKNIRRTSGNYVAWSGLAPDDSPLVLRDIGTQEIYALDWEAP